MSSSDKNEFIKNQKISIPDEYTLDNPLDDSTLNYSLQIAHILAKNLVVFTLAIQVDRDENADDCIRIARIETYLLDPNLQHQLKQRLNLEEIEQLMLPTIVERAKIQALDMSKQTLHFSKHAAESTSKTNSITSFIQNQNNERGSSLLASSGGGSIFPLLGGCGSIITWDFVNEVAESPLEKLQQLLNIKFIEDIQPDWRESVRPFLQETIRNVCVAPSLVDDDKAQLVVIADNLIQLYRQWFHLLRSNVEYRSMQNGLVEDLVNFAIDIKKIMYDDSVLSLGGNDGRSDVDVMDMTDRYIDDMCDHPFYEIHQRISKNVLDMFLDWTESCCGQHRSFVGDDRRQTIGQSIFCKLCPIDCDPVATWLYRWVSLLSPDQTINLFSLNSSTTSTNKESAGESTLTKSGLILQDLFCRTKAILEKEKQQKHELQFSVYTLSAIRSILISARVSRFPFHILSGSSSAKSHNNCNFERVNCDRILQSMFNMYLKLLQLQVLQEEEASHHEIQVELNEGTSMPTSVVDMCVEAIDTMLWGLRSSASKVTSCEATTDNLYPVMIAKIRDIQHTFLAKMKTDNSEARYAYCRLQKMMKRTEFK